MAQRHARSPKALVGRILAGAAVLASLALFQACMSGAGEASAITGEDDPMARANAMLHIAPPSQRDPGRPRILVHYMPWYQAPPTDSYGWHWHMGFYEPGKTQADGTPSLATHYPPLTGPYDSRDPQVLEYQALLMRIAGIDGVIADWYGSEAVLDYAQVHQATEALFQTSKAFGLSFALCYEDQSIGKAVEAGTINRADIMPWTEKQFAGAVARWMADPAYQRLGGQPVLLNFGPQYLLIPDQWERLFSTLPQRPRFISLDGHMGFFADGSYPWPPMWASQNGVLTAPRLATYLNEAYRLQQDKPWLVATAWPRFHDIYAQAQVAGSYGYLDDAQGGTFRLTLDAALKARPDIIQIATWNDYGEGTVVEPNTVYGYRDLETLQDLRRSFEADFPFQKADLAIPLALFHARRTGAAKPTVDAIVEAIKEGRADSARELFSQSNLAALSRQYLEAQRIKGAATSETEAAISDPLEGRKNLALGASIRANGFVATYKADQAVDGSTVSYWEGNPGQWPGILTLDLGTTVMTELVRIRLNPRQIWGPRTQEISIEGSLDAVTWFPLSPREARYFDPARDMNSVVIPAAASLRYLRISFFTNTGATAGQVAEVEVYSPIQN